MDAVQQQFTQLLAQHGISLSNQQLDQYETYYRLLVEWNEKMNLTGITEREAVYIKHFYDSISLSFFVPLSNVRSIADIGSGAGFPSIPVKIAFPQIKVTIVDSLNKRITFLKHLVEQLGLTDVDCVHGRAEDIARMGIHRDQYDLVTARAVARLAALNELCLPFAKSGGLFASMKGADPTEEVEEARYSINALKSELRDVKSFQLPVEDSKRHIVLIEKKGSTPAKYPRKAGVPIKTPLIK